jgi:hypothetical protein
MHPFSVISVPPIGDENMRFLKVTLPSVIGLERCGYFLSMTIPPSSSAVFCQIKTTEYIIYVLSSFGCHYFAVYIFIMLLRAKTGSYSAIITASQSPSSTVSPLLYVFPLKMSVPLRGDTAHQSIF